ncbi:MAG: RES domain-containing protein [Candidatus Rokubacteria bacterium]|nr:RES domain-containing protein [Candidatus Rokubacteria bacterium]
MVAPYGPRRRPARPTAPPTRRSLAARRDLIRGELGIGIEALYLASDEATVWAEWYRHLAGAGIPPNQQMPRDLWTWAVDPGLEVVDLTSAEQLKRVGLPVPRPGRRTWPSYQEVGETLWREGWPSLVALSAARPRDGRALCLFREPARVPRARPLAPPRVVHEPPAPPVGLTT